MPSTVYSKVSGDVSPLSDQILVVNMEKGEKVTKGGLIILDDNGKNRGIRPRWAQVYKVGSKVDYLEPGEFILIEHGRWTYGIPMEIPEADEGELFYLQRVDPTGVLLVSDERPENI
jgi:hypothetical protein